MAVLIQGGHVVDPVSRKDGQFDVWIENDRIRLVITDARQIDFEGYKPNPEGEFTEEQRACRNWIFANYLLDGMPL